MTIRQTDKAETNLTLSLMPVPAQPLIFFFYGAPGTGKTLLAQKAHEARHGPSKEKKHLFYKVSGTSLANENDIGKLIPYSEQVPCDQPFVGVACGARS